MTTLREAVHQVQSEQKKSGKPLAIILAGHNGSGKSTMWSTRLVDAFRIPLVNADRMMLSILPEVDEQTKILPPWARVLRDEDVSWMGVAQKGVEAFVAQALLRQVPFAMETVFSHWKELGRGRFESKIDLIRQMQEAGYFVLLFFVGLADLQLSIARVSTRVASGGHGVDTEKLTSRFPRTQLAIRHAVSVADAAILTDNSRDRKHAFTVCRVQLKDKEIFDLRVRKGQAAPEIARWLDVVSPRATA